MEISLQSRITYKTVHKRRCDMITKEKLHILDGMNYSRLQELHQRYGKELTEEEFARYFLDIDWRSYYNLQSGRRAETVILEREFYLEDEIDEIENVFIEESGLTPNDKINYETIVIFHNTYGGRFPLKTFADEILGINAHRVDDLNFNKASTAFVFKEKKYSRSSVREIRKRIESECNLHMKSQITLEQFEELYKKYGEGKIDDRVFALKILGITVDSYLRFKNGKRSTIIIFGTYPLNPDYICELRENVILSEKLRIDDFITVERFDELYQKYGGILPEELFAQEILDVSYASLQNARRRKNNLIILDNIEVPEEYIKTLRERIVHEKNFNSNQLKSLDELIELYSEYGYPLSEKQFITKVLGVSINSYYFLNAGSIMYTYILSDDKEHDFDSVRAQVIKECNLHYDDKIDYTTFYDLYLKYGTGMREYVFADKILDIDQVRLDNLRHDKENATTHILLAEPLPSDDEIERIKGNVIKKYNLSANTLMDYKTFRKIYDEFSGIMPEDMFAFRILDISESLLKQIKRNISEKIYILRVADVSKEKIEAFRIKVLMENHLYSGYRLTFQEFCTLYKTYERVLSEEEFAGMILGISEQSLRKLRKEDISYAEIKSLDMDESQIIDLRTRIWVDNNIFPGLKIKLKDFEKIYNAYEHTLSESDFAKMILGIYPSMFKRLKEKEKKSVEVWKDVRVKEGKQKDFSLEELDDIKDYMKNAFTVNEISARVLHSVEWIGNAIANLQVKGEVNLDEWKYAIVMRFFMLNNSAAKIQKITRISLDEVKSIVKSIKADIKAEDKRRKEEEKRRIAQEEKAKAQKNMSEMNDGQRSVYVFKGNSARERVEKILQKFGAITDRSKIVIREYIKECDLKLQLGILTLEELDVLGNGIEFIQGGVNDIVLFSRACAHFEEYERAYKFISINMDNEGIDFEGQEKLKSIRYHVSYALKKQRVVQMILRGVTDVEDLVKKSGVLEVDVIPLLKTTLEKDKVSVPALPVGPPSPPENR